DAVFASCALPGYLPPREIRGRFYVDGATVDNLPVGTARILGADMILAVDVSASNAFRADTQEEGFAAVFARATEIAMQALLELRLREWTTPPIYYVHPRVEHIPFDSFDHLREVVEEGYRSTAAALDRPEEWPALGDGGGEPLDGRLDRQAFQDFRRRRASVLPRRGNRLRQGLVIVEREIVRALAEKFPMRRDVGDHHRRGTGDRLHRSQPEPFEPAGADHHLGAAVGGDHFRLRERGLDRARNAELASEPGEPIALRTVSHDAYGEGRLEPGGGANDRRMVLRPGEPRHAEQPGARRGSGREPVRVEAERHLATFDT